MNKQLQQHYNIITFGRRVDNLLTSIERNIIGTFLRTAPDYIFPDATVFLHCRSLIWGKAQISSNYYYDEERIWVDKVYPHRFNIKNVMLTTEPISLVGSGYSNKFREAYGSGWAYKIIFAPKPLPVGIAIKIEQELEGKLRCDYDEFKKSIVDFSQSKKTLNSKKME